MAHTVSPGFFKDFTFRLTERQGIRTFFIDNRQFGFSYRINHSTISVGDSFDVMMNTSCADNITDGGWYSCNEILYGDYVSLYIENATE